MGLATQAQFGTRARLEWRLRSRTLTLGERTLVMAILNLTPDSFSGDGLANQSVEQVVAAAVQAWDGGADILDVGAESTRPGATALGAEREQMRLLPLLVAILKERPEAVVSVDTYHAATAKAAVAAGAEIVNDVSGMLWDKAMPGVLAEARPGVVLMHTRGRPQEWASLPGLAEEAVVPMVLEGLRERLAGAVAAGIAAESVVLDPGFGFGKRGAENMALLRGVRAFAELGRPLLVGVSRKRFLGDGTPAAGVHATVAANVAAILGGAHIVRVHDVQAAREAAAVADRLVASS